MPGLSIKELVIINNPRAFEVLQWAVILLALQPLIFLSLNYIMIVEFRIEIGNWPSFFFNQLDYFDRISRKENMYNLPTFKFVFMLDILRSYFSIVVSLIIPTLWVLFFLNQYSNLKHNTFHLYIAGLSILIIYFIFDFNRLIFITDYNSWMIFRYERMLRFFGI